MAPPKRRTGGRVTPKGTTPGDARRSVPKADVEDGVHRASTASSRYTPPKSVVLKEPSRVLPIAMFTLWILGALVIIFNYLDVLLPGATNNWYLLVGLGLILAGLFVATKWE